MAEQQPNLFSQIQQGLAKLTQPVQPAGQILGQTEAVQRISQAASGKQTPGAMAGAAPARSIQGERQVVDQVRRGQEELAKQNQIQQLALAQQARSIEDEEQFKNKLLSEEQLAARDKYLTTQGRILNEYTNGQRSLDLNKDKSRLEQLGFSMRLSNDKYMQELDRQAKLANLSDAISFEEEMYRTIFADEEELLRSDLNFRAILAADQRQFQDELAQMNIDMALDLAKSENKALAQKQMWDGVGGLMQAGVFAYDKGMFDSEAGSEYTGAGSSQQAQDITTRYGGNVLSDYNQA